MAKQKKITEMFNRSGHKATPDIKVVIFVKIRN